MDQIKEHPSFGQNFWVLIKLSEQLIGRFCVTFILSRRNRNIPMLYKTRTQMRFLLSICNERACSDEIYTKSSCAYVRNYSSLNYWRHRICWSLAHNGLSVGCYLSELALSCWLLHCLDWDCGVVVKMWWYLFRWGSNQLSYHLAGCVFVRPGVAGFLFWLYCNIAILTGLHDWLMSKLVLYALPRH